MLGKNKDLRILLTDSVENLGKIAFLGDLSSHFSDAWGFCLAFEHSCNPLKEKTLKMPMVWQKIVYGRFSLTKRCYPQGRYNQAERIAPNPPEFSQHVWQL